MKTFKVSLVVRTRENTDVSITLYENNYRIQQKSKISSIHLLNSGCFGEVVSALTLVHKTVVVPCVYQW